MNKSLALLGGVLALAAIACPPAQAQNAVHKLTKVWETKATLKVPESVRLDAKRKVLYVSNIDGEPWTADGKGSIGKVGLDGKVIDAEWVKGLDCPKGMALSDDGKRLYVADLGGVVAIDIKSGKIKSKVAIPDGLQLNDLVNDGQGHAVCFRLQGQEGLRRAGRQGVGISRRNRAQGAERVVSPRRRAVRARQQQPQSGRARQVAQGARRWHAGRRRWPRERQRQRLHRVRMEGGVWYVNADGSKQLLFDGKAEKTSTADIGWDPATMTVYVPTFFKNTVIAFKVE